jgi:hypothetical protein
MITEVSYKESTVSYLVTEFLQGDYGEWYVLRLTFNV